jgi:hypothetical protein
MQHAVPSSIDGLWLVLVEQDSGTSMEGRVPLMARAGDEQKYLLAFKNAPRARKFLETSNVPVNTAEPRLVVRSNKDELLRVARANGVVGVLVDYDPISQAYTAASAL